MAKMWAMLVVYDGLEAKTGKWERVGSVDAPSGPNMPEGC